MEEDFDFDKTVLLPPVPKEKRGAVYSTRFNPDDFSAVCAAAEREHLSVGQFIRWAAVKAATENSPVFWLRYEPGMNVTYTR